MVIVCFGPGPVFKGGISNYNTSLAKALDAIPGVEVHIVSWTQQYPAIIPRDFKDHKSKIDLLEHTMIKVHYITNYNNPLTWYNTVKLIGDLKPEAVIFQWAIAIQGLPMGHIAGRLNRMGIKTVFDLHFVIQKESSALDLRFTKMALSKGRYFITHARKTYEELCQLYPDQDFHFVDRMDKFTSPDSKDNRTVVNLFHPVYNMFAPKPDFDIEHFKMNYGLRKHVFLFFGFIRKYKGLHHVIQSYKLLADRRDDVSLLICGESFWQTLDQTSWRTRAKSFLFGIAKKLFLKKADNEQNYRPLELIDALQLRERVVVFNEFIANDDVHKYFQVSDAVLLFYEYATPSGVESIGYNFHMPIIATAVGHFPETVRNGFNGYLVSPGDIEAMADTMERFIEQPIDRANVAATTVEMSWDNYAKRVVMMIGSVS